MYYALCNNAIIMFISMEDRDDYVRKNTSACALTNILDPEGDLPVVLYSCLNCVYCSIDDSVMSRSMSCCVDGGKDIAWSGVGDDSYFHLLERNINNPHYISNHCPYFLPSAEAIGAMRRARVQYNI